MSKSKDDGIIRKRIQNAEEFVKEFNYRFNYDGKERNLSDIKTLIDQDMKYKQNAVIDNLLFILKDIEEIFDIESEEINRFLKIYMNKLRKFTKRNKSKEIGELLDDRAWNALRPIKRFVKIEKLGEKIQRIPSEDLVLERNLKILNECFGKYGITFRAEENFIQLIEKNKYELNNRPELKARLKFKYQLTFNQKRKWHIPRKGLETLRAKVIKFKTEKPIKELKEIFFDYLNKIGEFELRRQMIDLFKKYPEFFEAPAAKYYHHNYRYGLIEHTNKVIEISLVLHEITPNNYLIDRDLMIAGSAIHDIGKIDCYILKDDYVETSEKYAKLGHKALGIKIVSREIYHEKLDDLLHIIRTHHGLKDYQEKVEPITLEAKLVHRADDYSGAFE